MMHRTATTEIFTEMITADHIFKFRSVLVQTDQYATKRLKAVISNALRWHRR